jgi:hypothetical protein
MWKSFRTWRVQGKGRTPRRTIEKLCVSCWRSIWSGAGAGNCAAPNQRAAVWELKPAIGRKIFFRLSRRIGFR